MKNILTGFLVVVVASLGYASPVASVNGADGIEWGDGDWEPTAADYIQDGLIYLWDSGEQVISNNSFVVTIDNRPEGGEIEQTEWTAEICLAPLTIDDVSQIRIFFNNAPYPFLLTKGSGVLNAGYPPNGLYNGTQTYYGTGPYRTGRFIDSRDTSKLYCTSTTSLSGGIKGCIYKDGSVWNNYDGLSAASTTPVGAANYRLCNLYSNYPRYLEYMNSVRVYNRVLSPLEIQYNYRIDRMRFDLP